MTYPSIRTERFPPSDPEESDAGGPESDNDYEWAEYNLPVFPALRGFFREEAGDETDFIGLAIDMDPQPFGNS